MADVVTLILLGLSLVLFFGFFAEFIFKRFGLPDILLLIVIGFILGPNVLGYVTLDSLSTVAPIFTTFTLLFLLFDGAFNINLSSLIREFSASFILTMFNFIISAAVITGVMVLSGSSFLTSLLTGFLLGGVSSAFVIPVLQQMKVKENLYSLLALESALTDVFCIVFSLTVIKVINAGQFGFIGIANQIVSLFAVAGLVGILGGIFWMILIHHVFKEHNYIMTVAYLILIYVLTEFLSGNGAIAALFFGLMLKNSKQLSSIIKGITTHAANDKKKALQGELGVSVTSPSEQDFYDKISFLLKTFFFVFIGILIDLSDWKALIIGVVISAILMVTRVSSMLLSSHFKPQERIIVNSMFARGLAAAAIAQLAIELAVPQADLIAKVTYVVITMTIIFSSLRIFLAKRKIKMPYNV
ncbi:MAG: cation:proton antiporter [archaeon]|nr:cation:proton antiporter [archaeon]